MPNTIVTANGEALPKIDRASIMRSAWAIYRLTFTRSWIKQPFSRANFAWCLSCAWQKDREARMTAKERQVARIEWEIDDLKYKSFRLDTLPAQRRLENQHSQLTA